MGRWNGHKCEFISSLVASFHFQNNKKWQNSRSSALPSLCLQPLLLQHINNTTINLVTDAEHWGELHWSNWWGERGGDKGGKHQMFNGIDWRPVACGCRTTQQPTAELNREGIDRICVAIWRAIKHRNTTISPITVIEVDAQLCCYTWKISSTKTNEYYSTKLRIIVNYIIN